MIFDNVSVMRSKASSACKSCFLQASSISEAANGTHAESCTWEAESGSWLRFGLSGLRWQTVTAQQY